MDVSVVIVSWNVREQLDRALRSVLAARSDAGLRVIDVTVVDNASQDGSAEHVRRQFPDVRLIGNDSNAGFAAGCNQAIRHAHGDAVLLLNPDAELHAGALGRLAEGLAVDPRCGAAVPALVDSNGRIQASRRRFPTLLTAFMESTILQDHFPHTPHLRWFYCLDQRETTDHEVDWAVGACLLLRRAALESVGNLDQRFFMYFEEVDWFLRARQAGWSARYVPDAVVQHDGGASSAQVPEKSHLYFVRSKHAYYAKHFGPVAGRAVHAFLLLSYFVRALEDAGKFLVGHRRSFRRARIAMFLSVLRQAVHPAESPLSLTGRG